MDVKDIINLGYTAADIMDVLGKGNPEHRKKFRKALSFGYPAVSIIKHLFGKDSEDDEGYMTLEEKAKHHEKTRHNKQAMAAGLTAAALAGGIGLAARGGAGALGAASQVIPTAQASGTPPPPPPGGASANPLSAQAIPQQASQMGQNAPNTPSPQVPQTAPTPPQTPQNAPQINFFDTKLAKENPSGIINFVEKHQEAGKTPEETNEIIRKTHLHGPKVEAFEKEHGISFINPIKQIYDSTNLNIPEEGHRSEKSKSFFSTLFNELETGKAKKKFGLIDPIIVFAQSHFDKGEIKSPLDLEKFYRNHYKEIDKFSNSKEFNEIRNSSRVERSSREKKSGKTSKKEIIANAAAVKNLINSMIEK
jgi:hypothetical protein